MTTTVGYARVSTFEQILDLQRDALDAAGCKKIFTDTASGSRSDRPDLEQALDYVREGDVLVVWRLDRLGRSLKYLIEIITTLNERGIGFKSVFGDVNVGPVSYAWVHEYHLSLGPHRCRMVLPTKPSPQAPRAPTLAAPLATHNP